MGKQLKKLAEKNGNGNAKESPYFEEIFSFPGGTFLKSPLLNVSLLLWNFLAKKEKIKINELIITATISNKHALSFGGAAFQIVCWIGSKLEGVRGDKADREGEERLFASFLRKEEEDEEEEGGGEEEEEDRSVF